MGEFYRLTHIDTAAETPTAYAGAGDAVYLFTGRQYRPNFHLLLRRRSPDDTDLFSLVAWLPEEVKNELLERYTDAEEPDDWWGFSRHAAVDDAIETASIQVYVLDRAELGRLLDPEDTLLTASRRPPDAGDQPETIAETRRALSAELGSILAARWSSKDGADQQYHRYSALGTAWLAFDGLIHGVGSGMGSVASDYQHLGQEVADAAATLWQVTLDALESMPVSLDGLRELLESAYDEAAEAARALADFIINLAEAVVRELKSLSWESIRAWFEAVGSKAVDSIERAVALAEQGINKLRVLLRDTATLRVLIDFMAGYMESFHDDWWLDAVEAIGQLLGIVAVEALIELGLAAATAGVAAYVNGGRLIGVYSTRAVRYLARIHDELIRATQQIAEEAMDIGRQLSNKTDLPPKPKRGGSDRDRDDDRDDDDDDDDRDRDDERRGDDGQETQPARLPQTQVDCFDATGSTPYSRLETDAERREFIKEYHQQLKRQQEAINSLSAEEFQAARQAYRVDKRNPRAAPAVKRDREDKQDEIAESIEKTLRRRGYGEDKAEEMAHERAGEIMGKIDALHEPDMVAGGYGSPEPAAFGDSSVNQSIGPSWPSRIDTLDDAAESAVANGNGSARMNVKLEVCR